MFVKSMKILYQSHLVPLDCQVSTLKKHAIGIQKFIYCIQNLNAFYVSRYRLEAIDREVFNIQMGRGSVAILHKAVPTEVQKRMYTTFKSDFVSN